MRRVCRRATASMRARCSCIRAAAADRESEVASSQESCGTASPISSPMKVSTRSSSARLTPAEAGPATLLPGRTPSEPRAAEVVRFGGRVAGWLRSVTAGVPCVARVRNRVAVGYQAEINALKDRGVLLGGREGLATVVDRT